MECFVCFVDVLERIQWWNGEDQSVRFQWNISISILSSTLLSSEDTLLQTRRTGEVRLLLSFWEEGWQCHALRLICMYTMYACLHIEIAIFFVRQCKSSRVKVIYTLSQLPVPRMTVKYSNWVIVLSKGPWFVNFRQFFVFLFIFCFNCYLEKFGCSFLVDQMISSNFAFYFFFEIVSIREVSFRNYRTGQMVKRNKWATDGQW